MTHISSQALRGKFADTSDTPSFAVALTNLAVVENPKCAALRKNIETEMVEYDSWNGRLNDLYGQLSRQKGDKGVMYQIAYAHERLTDIANKINKYVDQLIALDCQSFPGKVKLPLPIPEDAQLPKDDAQSQQAAAQINSSSQIAELQRRIAALRGKSKLTPEETKNLEELIGELGKLQAASEAPQSLNFSNNNAYNNDNYTTTDEEQRQKRMKDLKRFIEREQVKIVPGDGEDARHNWKYKKQIEIWKKELGELEAAGEELDNSDFEINRAQIIKNYRAWIKIEKRKIKPGNPGNEESREKIRRWEDDLERLQASGDTDGKSRLTPEDVKNLEESPSQSSDTLQADKNDYMDRFSRNSENIRDEINYEIEIARSKLGKGTKDEDARLRQHIKELKNLLTAPRTRADGDSQISDKAINRKDQKPINRSNNSATQMTIIPQTSPGLTTKPPTPPSSTIGTGGSNPTVGTTRVQTSTTDATNGGGIKVPGSRVPQSIPQDGGVTVPDYMQNYRMTVVPFPAPNTLGTLAGAATSTTEAVSSIAEQMRMPIRQPGFGIAARPEPFFIGAGRTSGVIRGIGPVITALATATLVLGVVSEVSAMEKDGSKTAAYIHDTDGQGKSCIFLGDTPVYPNGERAVLERYQITNGKKGKYLGDTDPLSVYTFVDGRRFILDFNPDSFANVMYVNKSMDRPQIEMTIYAGLNPDLDDAGVQKIDEASKLPLNKVVVPIPLNTRDVVQIS